MPQKFDTIAKRVSALACPSERSQMALEDECIAESGKRLAEYVEFLTGNARSTDPNKEQRKRPVLSKSPAGFALLQQAAQPVADALGHEIKAALSGRPGPMNAAVRWLKDMPLEAVSVTALRILLDALDRPRLLVGVARAVGSAIFREAALLAWAKANPKLVKHVLATFQSATESFHYRSLRIAQAWSGEDLTIPPAEACVQVGTFVVKHVCDYTGFFTLQQRSQTKSTMLAAAGISSHIGPPLRSQR